MEALMRRFVGTIAAILLTGLAVAFWAKPTVPATGPDVAPAELRVSPFDIMQSSMPLPVLEIDNPM
jgi:hypothetical protein